MVPPSFWDKKDPLGGGAASFVAPATPSGSSRSTFGSTKKEVGSLKKPLVASTPRTSLINTSSSLSSTTPITTSSTKALSRPASRQTSRPGSRYGTLKREELKAASSVPTLAPSIEGKENGKSSVVSGSSASSSLTANASPTRPTTVASFTDAFLESCRNGDVNDAESKLADLRRSVLFQTIADEPRSAKGSSLRGKLWKVMLALDKVSSDDYIKLIEKKESPKYVKIRSDSFRTFKGCDPFLRVVGEVEIIRLLNSFVNKYDPYFTYCQGMNTICGPFLYVMPEVDAFFAFSKLVTKKFPLYWVCSHIGVQAGAILVDQCIKVIDKPLADHLEKHNLSAYIYAFHCISSLCASIPPFGELLKLWDFLLAFGPHFNILCVVAQVIMLRERILESNSPKGILDPRKWPALRARAIISIAMAILPSIPYELYQKICLHASDPAVAGAVASRSCDNYIPLPKEEEDEPTEL